MYDHCYSILSTFTSYNQGLFAFLTRKRYIPSLWKVCEGVEASSGVMDASGGGSVMR
jgi:hypothetical protein